MTSPNSASPPGTEVSITGTRVPQLGFGTWLLYGEAATEAIADAVKVGYRHIDTARGYENERRVGAALATTQIARSDLFITTKILLSGRDHPIPGAIGYKPGLISWLLDDSIANLQLEQVDLLLLHWPNPGLPLNAVLREMASSIEDGRVRHIGVSNFTPNMLERACDIAPIFCNQVEYHVYLSQDRSLEVARARDVLTTAYKPLANGKAAADPVLARIGQQYRKTAGQVAIRWLIDQPLVATIPSGPTADWRRENFDVFDFTLSESDRDEIAALPKNMRLARPSWEPDWAR